MIGTTVHGSLDGVSVFVPFTTVQNYDLSQQAFNSAATVVGSLYVPTVAGGNATVPVGTQGVMVTTPGITSYGQLPNTTGLLIVTGTGDTVSAVGGNIPMTVLSGSGSSLVFINNDTSSTPSSRAYPVKADTHYM